MAKVIFLVVCLLAAVVFGHSSRSNWITLRNGVLMPPVLLGTGYNPPKDAKPDGDTWQNKTGYLMTKAWLTSGGRGIDTALNYHTQEGIRAAIDESGVNPDEVFVLTKIDGVTNESAALRLLEIDYEQLGRRPIGAIIIHWCWQNSSMPPGFECTPENILGTWRALETFYQAGKVKAIGVSNFCVWNLTFLVAHARVKPHIHQVERSPYFKQETMVQYCKREGIHLQGYAPLNDADRQNPSGPAAGAMLRDPVLVQIAAKHNITPAQVALLWNLQGGHSVTPRVGGPFSTVPNLDHISQNIAVSEGQPPLDFDDMAALDALPNYQKCWNDHPIC